MTLGEVKVEALRIMGVNLAEDIRALGMDEILMNENYRSFLVNMTGPINRCLSVFFRRGVIKESVRVTHESANTLELSKLGVSDELADIIPFYIESELYVTEEPELAVRALGLFESALTEIMAHGALGQERVRDIMGGLK